MLEGLFVFGGLSYLASSLTDRFGINYAYAGLMVAGFGLRRPDLQRLGEEAGRRASASWASC